MKLTRIASYQMDLEHKGMIASAAFMGLAFFFRALYFFAWKPIDQVGVWALIFQLILPLLLEAGWFILLRGVRLKMPIVYGILGAAVCLSVMTQTIVGGSLLALILAVLTCLICALGFLAVILGYVNSRFVAAAPLLLLMLLRLIFGGLPQPLLEMGVFANAASLLAYMAALSNQKQ